MPARPGKLQLDWLAMMALGRFQVVGDPLTARIVRRGDARAFHADGASFVGITPQGLRTLADAIDAGQVAMPEPDIKARSSSANEGCARKETS